MSGSVEIEGSALRDRRNNLTLKYENFVSCVSVGRLMENQKAVPNRMESTTDRRGRGRRGEKGMDWLL